MWNMQLCTAHLLVGSDFRYLWNSASGGAKTPFLGQKWLYFQSHLLSFKDIDFWKAPKDAPWKTEYFAYQALNFLIISGGLNCGNRLAKTGTEPAGSGFSCTRYSRNSPKMELLLTLFINLVMAAFMGNYVQNVPATSSGIVTTHFIYRATATYPWAF
jgi:hypothetical protein